MIDLETERLRFRQWRKDDFALFAEYFSKPETAKYVGGEKSPEEAWRLMATYIGHYELNGFSYLALESKSESELVGTVGLWKSSPWPETELGYWLRPQMQGRGYGLEAAKSVLSYGFNELHFETIVSYIDPENSASIRLAEKLGGFDDGELELLDFGRHRIYRYNAI